MEESTINLPEPETQSSAQIMKQTHKLSDEQRTCIIQAILQHIKNGKPARGVMKKLAEEHNISSKTVQRLWVSAKKQIQQGKPISIPNKMKGKAYGREKISISVEEVSAVSPSKRRTIRALAKTISRSKSTVHRMVSGGKIKAHTNSIKPYLSEANKVKRLQFCISKLKPSSVDIEPRFEEFYNYVHVDEKWFYMTETTKRVYAHADEENNLHRTVQSKKFITKVMFLATSARLQYSETGELTFDGKIGIFPFVVTEPAQRRSRNRPRGTLVTKPVLLVNKEVYKSFLIDKVLVSIKEKWPANGCKRIFIQQDNARPHLACDDPEFLAASKSVGFDIELICQLPNSQDLNVLDLGYFRAIQALQQEKSCKTIDDLVEAVLKSYYEFDPKLSNFVWLSLQYCMGEVIKVLGCNAYKIPHVGKNTLLRIRELPKSVYITIEAVAKANYVLSMLEVDWTVFLNEDTVGQFMEEDN